MTPEEAAAALLSRGYVEVQSIKHLAVGQRVRHVGQRFWQAIDNGTANIERLFHKENSAWTQKYGGTDIEMIAKRDDGSYGYWADYHAVVVNKEEVA